MSSITALGFGATALAVAEAARRLGLDVPGFRSPPGLPGAVRTIRRAPDGSVVAVAFRGRSAAEVLGDLVAGVVEANQLAGDPAVRAAEALRQAAAPMLADAAEPAA